MDCATLKSHWQAGTGSGMGPDVNAALPQQVRQHLAVCDDCRRHWQEQERLTQSLAQLARDVGQFDAPSRVEAQLRTAFAQHHTTWGRSWQRRVAVLAMPLALAASITGVSWMMRAPLSAIVPAGQSQSLASPASDSARGELGTAFFPLVPLKQIAQNADTRVVEVTFPRTVLASFGLPIDPARAGEPVAGEMLLAANGAPLAVRFITASLTN